MGISIYYCGSIANPKLLPVLIDEVRDIAEVFGWKYNVKEREFPEKAFGKSGYNDQIYGINFTPPDCETVSISFLSNGRMSDGAHLKFFGKTEARSESEYLYMLSVKTQFAGADLHQFLILFFRYLSKKYLSGFELSDDGGYWETNDENLLKANFKKNAVLINSFASAINNFPIQPGESLESYFERLLRQIEGKRK